MNPTVPSECGELKMVIDRPTNAKDNQGHMMIGAATNLPVPPGYEKKFAGFIKLCKTTKQSDFVVIATPCALGDNYEEVIESLNRLADSGAGLQIVPRSQRGGAKSP